MSFQSIDAVVERIKTATETNRIVVFLGTRQQTRCDLVEPMFSGMVSTLARGRAKPEAYLGEYWGKEAAVRFVEDFERAKRFS